jgi:hypothetical protein
MKKMTRIIHAPLAAITLGWLAVQFAPNGFGVVPPPDGGYPNFTTAEGTNALKSLTTGSGNTGIGWVSLFSATTASFNTGVGAGTLALNTADSNTASGAGALLLNTTGNFNTANGAFALLHNDAGSFNTASGEAALSTNTIGPRNTAAGFQALFSNSTGADNTATGYQALWSNVDGPRNTAFGAQALFANTGAGFQTAFGYQALMNATSGDNTAVGFQALQMNTGHQENVAVGSNAARNTDAPFNTAVGAFALFDNTAGGGNVAIGDGALSHNTTGVENIAVGANAGFEVHTANNVICIGDGGADVDNSCYIGQIFTATSAGGTQVFINSSHKLGTMTSSSRFKEDIKPMDTTSDAIYELKPVTFHYKKEIDPAGISQCGLVAEDVEKVNPDLIVRDAEGKPYSVRYDQVNAMLLNEFLKEHRKVQDQGRKIKEQETTIAELKKQVQTVVAHAKEQDIKIQRVSDRIQISSSPVVVTDR